MCGIFGVSYKDPKQYDEIEQTAERLLLLSEKRGKEASGIAILSDKKARVLRVPQKASVFIQTHQYKKTLNNLINMKNVRHYPLIIGNTRLATNGTAYDSYNNQPVVTTETIGVHNGMIVNEEVLWKKFSSLKREYDVDTEVILKLFELFIHKGEKVEEAIRHIYEEIEGAATVAMMNIYVPGLVVTTNTGSLYYVCDEHQFVFASEEYIVRESINDPRPIHQLQPGHGIFFDYREFALSMFSFQTFRQKGKIKIHKDPFFSIDIFDEDVKNFYIAEDTKRNTLRYLEQHAPDYDALAKIRRCTRCILPETMPLIAFDEHGVCNFCNSSRPIQYKGRQALEREIERYMGHGKSKKCIVALSGGRDSSFGLHYVKNILGLTPVAYTYDWGMVTDVARRNQYRLTAKMGVEHIIVSADIRKKRENIKKNVEAWLRRPNLAMVPLFMAGDKQAEYYAEKIKKETGIRLIIYCRGNELEDERFKFGYYGIFDGTPQGVLHNLSWTGKMNMALYYAREFFKNPSYINSSIFDTAFAYFSAYLMPHTDFLYLWHYIPWNEKEIIDTLKNTYGWETASDTIATWRIDDGTPPFYNYIYYRVQGFTEHDGLRSNQIRQGMITRQEALRLVKEENKPRYEAIQWYFDAIKVDGDRALSIIDRMRTMYKLRHF